MSVVSEVDHGSVFSFSVLLGKGADDSERALDAKLLPARRVLCVDDNATNRDVLELTLRGFGVDVRCCESPWECLDEASKGYDLIVLDHQMPELSGDEVAWRLRGSLGDACPPLLLLTSVGREAVDLQAGLYDGTLTKPVKRATLKRAMERMLRGNVAIRDATADSPIEMDSIAPTPIRILLAEDNAVNQKVALRMLGRLGYRADLAGNGTEALALIRAHPYDLVLMDVQMPDVDGLAATKTLRRLDVSQPWIIAMTANAQEQDRLACLEAGMDDYLAKPVRVEQLAAAIERFHCRTDGDDAMVQRATSLVLGRNRSGAASRPIVR